MNNYNYIQKLHPSWTVDDFDVSINKVDIRIQDILSYEVVFGSEIIGIVSFTDGDDLVSNMPISIGGLITISYTSQAKTKYGNPAPFKKTYVITKVNSHVSNKSHVVTINFEDKNTSKLKSSYISRSYTNMSPSDMLTEYGGVLELENFGVVAKENEDKISIHTPAHISANEFLSKDLEYRGYSIIQDRFSSYIVHDSHRRPEDAVSTGETFEFMPSTEYSRGQVLEYNIEGFDMITLQNSIPSISNNINSEKMSQESMDTDVSVIESTSTATVGGVSVTQLLNSSGAKMTGNKYSSSDVETLTKELNNLQKMSIWVPGWNGNRLGMSVKIELPKPLNVNQSENSETYSGEWIVNKVRDKIVNTYFIQELFVSRAGK